MAIYKYYCAIQLPYDIKSHEQLINWFNRNSIRVYDLIKLDEYFDTESVNSIMLKNISIFFAENNHSKFDKQY